MNLLIIGSGGREHALAWKLTQSPRVDRIFCAPGNGGTATFCTNLPIGITNAQELIAAAKAHSIDLTVVGPDDALAAGVVDQFQRAGLRVFGPTQAAAQLESSKSFTKSFLQRHQIPTAFAKTFTSSKEAIAFCKSVNQYPIVIKADGLATGKGVVIANDEATAAEAITQMIDEGIFGDAGKRILIEEFLVGSECSLHVLLDGTGAYKIFPLAQDHKRLNDNDEGPNTGGMGTVSPPVKPLDAAMLKRVEDDIVAPIAVGLAKDQIDFQGLLFPGLMITNEGPKVIELNARFGDPETQVLLPRLENDLLELIEAVIDRNLKETQIRVSPKTAVCVVLASEGYPRSPLVNRQITGVASAQQLADTHVFHAGTKWDAEGRLVTSGGRVLGVTSLGENLEQARARSYQAAEQICFQGKHARTDIATPK